MWPALIKSQVIYRSSETKNVQSYNEGEYIEALQKITMISDMEKDKHDDKNEKLLNLLSFVKSMFLVNLNDSQILKSHDKKIEEMQNVSKEVKCALKQILQKISVSTRRMIDYLYYMRSPIEILTTTPYKTKPIKRFTDEIGIPQTGDDKHYFLLPYHNLLVDRFFRLFQVVFQYDFLELKQRKYNSIEQEDIDKIASAFQRMFDEIHVSCPDFFREEAQSYFDNVKKTVLKNIIIERLHLYND